ncbi:MAG: TonB-dependent siderophore receptor, partial [Alphaproteobacteria bacterium]
DIFAGYAYLDGRITKSTASVAAPQTPPARQISLEGNRPSLTPEHSGFVWINQQLIGGFSAGGGLNYSADRFASTSNAVVLPGYVTADLAAFHRSKLFDLALNVKNVTNRKYVVSGHGGNDNLITPGGPREFQFTATYKF